VHRYPQAEAKKVSQVDGIIGVLPNQKGENELLITGQIDAGLRNLFSSGKSLAFEWQSFNANSQLLNARYYHPNLLKTPVNIQAAFDLLKAGHHLSQPIAKS
jgi:hypothetical protein